MDDSSDRHVEVRGDITTLRPEEWDVLANPASVPFNPFVCHAFLAALERSGSVGPGTGWRPTHVLLREADGRLSGAMPCYMKSHSRGEYVFDQAWADAYHRAGGRYYPKLQCAVPFSPVPGPRILVGDGEGAEEREQLLALAAMELTGRTGASSFHLTFLPGETAERLEALGYLHRTDQQFHFDAAPYASFEEFLSSLASRKRKAIRRERAEAVAAGLEIVQLAGSDIREAHWDAFFDFYLETGSRKWGQPYLNRAFFSLLGETMAEHCLLVLALRDGRPIAGALNLIGGDCLYGRYWGAIEHHPFLHFEICYYQAIEYAILRKLPRVEAGAQGEHKLARGYAPTVTHSAHYIADPGLAAAVARYLRAEREHNRRLGEVLSDYTPFRRGPAPGEPPVSGGDEPH